jgi:hypothetical protein
MYARTQRSIAGTRRAAARSALGAVLAAGLLGALASPAFANGPPAAFTTWVDPLGCLDSPNGVDCNNYRAKPDVYMNGGPVSAALADGTYFFAVVTPGEQNGGFLDGARGNLSDTSGGAGFTAGDDGTGDDVSNRTFSVTGGVIAYGGSHATGTNPLGHFVIQLMPYDDTDNPGGVYILAVCAAGATSPADCKYDAFHVQHQAAPPDVLKDATPTFGREYKWTVKKEVDHLRINEASGGSATFNYTVTVSHDDGTDKNWQVNGKITVNNSNADPVTGVDVTDAVNDPHATCTVTGGAGLTVAGGGSVAVPYTCTYSSAPANPTETNTATITWPAQDLSDGPLAEGTASFALLFSFPASPGPIDDCVTVADPNAPTNPLGTACVGTDDNPKAFSYAHTFSGDPAGTCTGHDNTATFTANTTGTTGSASQTVRVCVGKDLAVSKTAATSFTRTFHWGVTKAVDKTQAKVVHATDTATFNYTVNAMHDAGTDGNWQVNGTITVTNPNDWEAITANVTDAVNDGGSCVVTGGSGASVPAGGSVALPYSCTYAAVPNPSSGTNTATAAWDRSAFFTVDGSAPGTALFAFTAPTTVVDGCAAVSDSLFGPLGTVCFTDPSPRTFIYSLAFPAPTAPPLCVSHLNTATLTAGTTGATGSASQTVTVCRVPIATGALTIGFWQNKNGQGVLTGGASTGGVCNSGTWLRQFAPYQDLGPTATCGQLAAYVTNVIKAASAAGSAMNAMLKAQMLATALDVYFSDPALGGNKIAAPAPIGGVAIDLTLVCRMIDGSGGTAACGGTFEDSSPVFGGSTHLTVSQMIAYASSQSSAGGSPWYANVKATQQLAKDAFDAINNQVAFAY